MQFVINTYKFIVLIILFHLVQKIICEEASEDYKKLSENRRSESQVPKPHNFIDHNLQEISQQHNRSIENVSRSKRFIAAPISFAAYLLSKISMEFFASKKNTAESNTTSVGREKGAIAQILKNQKSVDES